MRSVHFDNTSDYDDNEDRRQRNEHDLRLLLLLRRAHVLRLERLPFRLVLRPRLLGGLRETVNSVGSLMLINNRETAREFWCAKSLIVH